MATRTTEVSPREGAGVTAVLSRACRSAVTLVTTPGSGSRRGPTVSETHSESSAQKITRARRLRALVLTVPEAIYGMMTNVAKGMYAPG